MSRSSIPSERDELVYTVTEISRKIKRLLESHWAALWVEGELSNLKRHSSGHVYFTLKDDRAALRGVMFRSQASRLRFTPEDGQKVRVFGSLNVYEPQGSYQIQTVKMEPFGVGELELAFRQMYERLSEEGLFDPDEKRPLPEFPRTIGIVTSESGAALRDLLSVTARRAPHLKVIVHPAKVQGYGAADEIVRAIRNLNAHAEADVLVVGRGGGSLEDLWAFNEEKVARAIFASEIPVVSAVGHEVDVTIADYVADVRAATPSAAAELVAPERDRVVASVNHRAQQMMNAITRSLSERRERVSRLSASPAFREPMEFYRRRSQDVDRLTERLHASARGHLRTQSLLWERLSAELHALSPLAILDRGYSIVQRPSGEVVRSHRDVAEGDGVEVRLARGHLSCRVDSTSEGVPRSERSEAGS